MVNDVLDNVKKAQEDFVNLAEKYFLTCKERAIEFIKNWTIKMKEGSADADADAAFKLLKSLSVSSDRELVSFLINHYYENLSEYALDVFGDFDEKTIETVRKIMSDFREDCKKLIENYEIIKLIIEFGE